MDKVLVQYCDAVGAYLDGCEVLLLKIRRPRPFARRAIPARERLPGEIIVGEFKAGRQALLVINLAPLAIPRDRLVLKTGERFRRTRCGR